MFDTLLTFVPVAALLSITPGAATALVVRNAVRGGRRHAFFTTSGNSIGVLAWGCFAAVGVATLVSTSAAVFDTVKLAGAAVLLVIGLRSLVARQEIEARGAAGSGAAVPVSGRAALREGLITSLANPKLAVFFVALFRSSSARRRCAAGAPAMAAVIVAVDLMSPDARVPRGPGAAASSTAAGAGGRAHRPARC